MPADFEPRSLPIWPSRLPKALALAVAFLVIGWTQLGSQLAGDASASSSRCFDKKVDRIVPAGDRTVVVGFREVVRVTGGEASIKGGAFSTICTGSGSQTVWAGKGLARIDTGPGDDRIVLDPASHLNLVRAGTGDDYVRGSNGNDTILAGPAVESGDTDTIFGGGGNDTIRDFGGTGNEIHGERGSDRLRSLGSAESTVHGGDGTDFLLSNGGGQAGPRAERLFGDRGNDRLRADLPGGKGGAFFDPGPGDDWIWGTGHSDTIVYSAGIKKIEAGGGNDLVVSAGRGGSRVSGGPGLDTISFAAHTPAGYRDASGVFVDLEDGYAIGYNRVPLDGFEDVIGSAFDDEIRSRPGVDNGLRGGLGDDTLRGDPGDRDSADGGTGSNYCRGFDTELNCNDESPGDSGPSRSVVQMDESGILNLVGSDLRDEVLIGFDAAAGEFVIDADPAPESSGLCREVGGEEIQVRCPVTGGSLNGLLAYGGGGDDEIELADSIPAELTTTINGGVGRNVLIGGRSKDYISSYAGGSAGTVISGRGGSDVLSLRDDVSVSGGAGADVLYASDPCVGGSVSGGGEQDNLVFAGARRGVRADFGQGYAAWAIGGCTSDRLEIEHDIEDLEGSRFDDTLILGPRFETQDGPGALLGREGIDTLDSRNGRRDSVTVGSGGKENVVRADPFDSICWDWCLAGY
jgi:Ca2+-binding RTX toxin-like protein